MQKMKEEEGNLTDDTLMKYRLIVGVILVAGVTTLVFCLLYPVIGLYAAIPAGFAGAITIHILREIWKHQHKH